MKFAENMPYYLSLPLTDFNVEEKPYPIGRLGDISLYFVHYPDIESCKTQWRRRASRVDYNNLFLVMTDRNGCTDELVERFSKVPYPKVLFSSKEMPEYDFAVYVPGFSKDGQVGELNRYADFHGNRYYELYFDFVSFLNGDR